MGLRERNRRAAMRDTQREALRLFRERGFDGVTVEEIAGHLQMAASTVFRHFGTKEAIVLWDEHDAALDDALATRFSALRGGAPLHAVRDAFVDTLARRYQGDRDFELERVRFIYATDALHAAAVEAQLADREALTVALARLLSTEQRGAAPLLAGAAMLALDVAIEQWQEARGERDLGALIGAAFATLERLGEVR